MTMALSLDHQSTDITDSNFGFLRQEPIFAATAIGLIIAAIPMMAAFAVDTRTLLGINVWIKPLKFDLALVVYLLTLVFFARWLPAGTTQSSGYRFYSGAVAIAVILEMIWIAGAAANGIESHFNMDTPLMSAVYPVMGGLAVFLTTPTLVYSWLIWRDQQSMLEPVFRQSLVLGLVLTFVLTVAVAGYMSGMGAAGAMGYDTQQVGHFVGGNLSDAEAYPLMGWARDGGDLRVAHFFASHAMHFIPAFGFIAGQVLPYRLGQTAVVCFTFLFVGFVLYTLAEAMMGLPFLSAIA